MIECWKCGIDVTESVYASMDGGRYDGCPSCGETHVDIDQWLTRKMRKPLVPDDSDIDWEYGPCEPLNAIAVIIGKLPGDETDEQIYEALRDIS